MIETTELTEKLMEFKTVTPVENPAIFEFIQTYLGQHGIESEIHDINGVKNLTAETGDGETEICFNGHVDVVPPGEGWTVSEPFEPREMNGRLYGRGAADMKAGVAALVNAFIDLHEDDEFQGRCTLMIVGDEELGSENGSEPLVAAYMNNGHDFDYAVIGEPTDLNIQVGTRGAAWFNIYLKGEEMHAARAHLAHNVVNDLSDVINALNNLEMDYTNDTLLQDPNSEVTAIETNKTYNSIPSVIELGMDFRYVPGQSINDLRKEIDRALDQFDVEYDIELEIDHGGAYVLEDDEFKQVSVEEVEKVRGVKPDTITEGGGSDGRFFSEHGTPFIELGVNQEPVHQIDEYCKVENIEKLRVAYRNIAKRLVEKNSSRSESRAKV
jgi:succinyl-diaminopimelate desuccinylase